MSRPALRLLVLGCALAVPAWAAEPEQPASYWMKKKLEYSQNILNGMAKEDFTAIEKNARAMGTLNQMERWFRADSKEYRDQLQAFRKANEHMIQQAGEKNLDGCAIAYMQITLSCVQCHRVVRDSGRKP